MNIHNLNKKGVLLGVVGIIVLFFVFSFLSAYYEYQTEGASSEEPVTTYDDESFERLHQKLTKDKPQAKEQQKVLAEIVKDSNQPYNFVPASANKSAIYSKGNFDTLAVNCGILVEKYKELVIKYHELEKKVQSQGKKASTKKSTKSFPRVASNRTPGGFDYTRYIRAKTSNELLNESGKGGVTSLTNAQFTWATLSLRQHQKVFNQSVVTFDVAEAFELEGKMIPHLAKIEGVAQVIRGRGRIFIKFNKIYTQAETIKIEGDAFSLDKSRGINVFISRESSLAEAAKREISDLSSIIDPSRSQIGRSIIQDTDVGQEVFASLEAGTMILANIRKR